MLRIKCWYSNTFFYFAFPSECQSHPSLSLQSVKETHQMWPGSIVLCVFCESLMVAIFFFWPYMKNYGCAILKNELFSFNFDWNISWWCINSINDLRMWKFRLFYSLQFYWSLFTSFTTLIFLLRRSSTHPSLLHQLLSLSLRILLQFFFCYADECKMGTTPEAAAEWKSTPSRFLFRVVCFLSSDAPCLPVYLSLLFLVT